MLLLDCCYTTSSTTTDIANVGIFLLILVLVLVNRLLVVVTQATVNEVNHIMDTQKYTAR